MPGRCALVATFAHISHINRRADRLESRLNQLELSGSYTDTENL